MPTEAQLFISPPLVLGGAKTLTIDDIDEMTVGQLRHAIITKSISSSSSTNASYSEEGRSQWWLASVTDQTNRPALCIEDLRLSYCGRQLTKDHVTLSKEGITNGSTIQTAGRLRGGDKIKLKLRTSFGRVYEVEVNNIDDVSTIFDAVAAQNPSFSRTKNVATIVMKNGTILEEGRKIIIYDIQSDDELYFQVSPIYCFKRDFRRGPKHLYKDDENASEEYRAALAKLREKKAKEEIEAAGGPNQPDVEKADKEEKQTQSLASPSLTQSDKPLQEP